jgi:hypothetical protein
MVIQISLYFLSTFHWSHFRWNSWSKSDDLSLWHKFQNKLLHNILDRLHFFVSVTETWKSIWFYLIVVSICHWYNIWCHRHNIVHYITLSLTWHSHHVLVTSDLFTSGLLFLKIFDIYGVKLHILQKWTYNTHSQIYAILRLCITDFVDASENITFIC